MSYYEISNADKISKKSLVRQLVDILQVDIAGKNADGDDEKTRKKYQVFVTGGLENGEVTSSLFHTVFDQNNELQTSNEMLDMTIGLYESGSTVNSASGSLDASGKLVFGDDTLMMREKINMYKQYAQVLLGNSSSSFHAPFEDEEISSRIEEALFVNFKRLFVRDGLDKEQFSIKMHKKSADGSSDYNIDVVPSNNDNFILYSDANASQNLSVSTVSGQIGNIKNDNGDIVGIIFYDKGICVFDAAKVFDEQDTITGPISAVTGSTNTPDSFNINDATINFNGSFIPNFWVSGSIDNILDHIAGTRFGRQNNTAIGLINHTGINSTIYFCRVGPNDANFSTNPTYINSNGNIRSIQEQGDDPFSYITTVGLYDISGELLAVAKTSRPLEKNPEVDLSISVRIDY
jgi:hypothetical protein